MTTTDLEVGAELLRPKSLSAASLIRRALLGIAILTGFIILSAVLYDASTNASAGAAGKAAGAIGALPAQAK